MKIGIDARMYRSGVAGIGRYSQNLIKNLLAIDQENQYVLFMTKEDIEEIQRQKAKGKMKMQNVKIIKTDIAHYSIAEQTKLPRIIEREKCDLVHFLNFNYPVGYKGKFISVIHDLTLHFFPEVARQTNFIKRTAFEYVMKKACQNAEKIIAVSQSTKADIIKVFKTPSEKIEVIYEAADDKIIKGVETNLINLLKKKYKIDSPVILYVGQFRPHKNLPSLVEAFNEIRKSTACRLVMLGKTDPKYQSLQKAVSKSQFKNEIVMPGFVSDEELAAWYKLASCFVFPSLYEGFGLPGLEAMRSGTPVVSSNVSSLPEIYRDAAIYFDPFKIEEISAKIKSVLVDKDLRARLTKRGKEIAHLYTWKKTATQTLEVYKEILTKS